MTLVEKHEELLQLLQEAGKVAGDLCARRCAVRDVVAGLRDVMLLVKDRIREYREPPLGNLP